MTANATSTGMNSEQLRLFARELRLESLRMAHQCGNNGSHLGPAMSAIEIIATLYGAVMNCSPDNALDPNRDRLVISKGHCVLAYYSALRMKGFITQKDQDSFETDGSHFHGHALRNLSNGIEFSGGSLSMGMSFAVGQALACKKKGYTGRVFTLVGDGECAEGLIWEAAMAAAHYGLDNLTIIIDRNQLQYDGYTHEIMNNSPLEEKFRSFGLEVETVDGHDCAKLYDAFIKKSDTPRCVIANTVKGKGVSFMELNKEWHHHTLNAEQYEQAVKEVTSSCLN